MRIRVLVGTILFSVFALSNDASAACVNRFLAGDRSQAAVQPVTLLTGKLTFQEAQDLAQEPSKMIAWVDGKGATIARAVEVRVLRPMPVSCDGRPSGVVMQARFVTIHHPAKLMLVKISDGEPVEFSEQTE